MFLSRPLRPLFIYKPKFFTPLHRSPDAFIKCRGLLKCSDISEASIREFRLLYSGRCEDCTERENPDFVQKNKKYNRHKNIGPCWQALRRTEFRCRAWPDLNVEWFISNNKSCVSDQCLFESPRSDIKHFRVSDKLNRKYQRTWTECIPVRREYKPKCIFKLPPRRRRQIKKRSPRGCEKNKCMQPALKLKLMKCLPRPVPNVRCLRVNSPRCRPVSNPPTCRRSIRSPSYCHKRLTKYPSYSECLVEPLPEALPIECGCSKTPPMCRVWEYYRNKKS